MGDNFIFNPNKEKVLADKTKESVVYYTMVGLQDHMDSDNRPVITQDMSKVFAKTITTNGNTKFYIKTGTYGKIFNPIGMFSEGKNNKFVARTGRNEYEFKSVNQNIFDMYINFLSTKNLAWLNNAERGLI